MSADDTWTVGNTLLDAAALARHNSVFTISNGYLGLTGNLCEDREGPCPLTLINGVYDELDMFGLIGASRHERPWLDPDRFDGAGPSPAVANLPNPLFVRVFVEDRELAFGRGRVADFRQELDLRCGVYRYAFDYIAHGHTTRIEMSRFAALADPHRVHMRFRVTPAESGVAIRILSGISAAVGAHTTGARQFAVVGLESGPPETCRLHVRTNARKHDVRMTVVNRRLDAAGPTARGVCAHDAVYTVYETVSKRRVPITIERSVSLSCSEDQRHGARLRAAPDAQTGAAGTYDAAGDEQRASWKTIWDRADVQIGGDEPAQRRLRFCLYHLLAAAPRFTDRLSVPVKLLSGEYYQGNVFYDTDLYVVPFYTFTFPELARTCLNFRYAGLDHARALARGLGHAGAKFAWQAGPYGEECLGDWYRFPRTNIHINADVCYGLMQYYWATGDKAFMCERGVDILVESARFYASRATYDQRRDAYDIHDVAGPDEAHCQSTNNFYTNYLAGRTLRWAADVLDRIKTVSADAHADAVGRLSLGEDEPRRWRRVAERLTLLFDARTKLYEQCDGFHELPAPPADLLEQRSGWFVPLHRYQALNQPDVLMALALFRDEFPQDVRRANWEYYKDKSLNLSSMSFAINAIMAADAGAPEEAYRDFMISAGLDLDEALTGRHDTHLGLHGTAMGGAWLAAIFGFAGVRLSEQGLVINPNLPPHWTSLRFKLVLRGNAVSVLIDRQEVALTLASERDAELGVTVAGRPLTLLGGKTRRVRYRSAARQ